MSFPTSSGLQTRISKTVAGHGSKRATCVVKLLVDLLSEIHQLRAAGVKFNAHILLLLARTLVLSATSEAYGPTNRDPNSGELVGEHSNARWVERFMCGTSVVARIETGELVTSDAKQQLIEHELSLRLGTLQRGFSDGSLDELYVSTLKRSTSSFDLTMAVPWLRKVIKM